MIVNLTPHKVVILDDSNDAVFVFKRAKAPARFLAETFLVSYHSGVPITHTNFTVLENLPDQKEGVYYIVSQLVKSLLPFRSDLLVPTQIVHDGHGVVLGCRSLGI